VSSRTGREHRSQPDSQSASVLLNEIRPAWIIVSGRVTSSSAISIETSVLTSESRPSFPAFLSAQRQAAAPARYGQLVTEALAQGELRAGTDIRALALMIEVTRAPRSWPGRATGKASPRRGSARRAAFGSSRDARDPSKRSRLPVGRRHDAEQLRVDPIVVN
jgi:hypothetical protein